MAHPHAVNVIFDIVEGVVEYRIDEDNLEIRFGEDTGNLISILKFTEESVVTLAAIFEHVIPTLRKHAVLISQGRLSDIPPGRDREVVIGKPLPEIDDATTPCGE